MWPSARSIFLAALAATAVTAELSFVASVQQDGHEDVDAAALLKFVPIPPSRHRKHASPSRHGDSRAGRDLVSYSANWCGASQHVPQSEEISSVIGYFTVPDLTLRPTSPAPQFAAAWVGIDGAQCNTTLLQAGVTTIVNSNGGQSASAWWEWDPEAAYNIEGMKVKPGDWMSVNITTWSTTSATLVINNLSRSYSVTLNVSNGPKLCRQDVEWIVEDFSDASGQVVLANFSDVWFVQSGAETVAGRAIGLDGATMVRIKDEDGKILCTADPYDNTQFVISAQG